MVVTNNKGFLDWMIGFINTLYNQLVLTNNNSVTADLHNLQFTVPHALGILVFTSRILVTEFKLYHCD
jgi:hypothetical protein